MKTPPIIFDFQTIVDPIALLHGLILYRETHECIYVESGNLLTEIFLFRPVGDKCRTRITSTDLGEDKKLGKIITAYEVSGKRPGDKFAPSCILTHLLDTELPDWIARMDSYFNSYTLTNDNLLLAVRLLQHAYKEGFLKILPSPNLKDRERATLRSDAVLMRIGSQMCTNIVTERYQIETCSPYSADDTLWVTLRRGYHLSVGSHALILRKCFAGSKQYHLELSKTIREVIPMFDLSSLNDYYALIENPTILRRTVEKTKVLVEEYHYQRALHWFFPKFFLDKATGGTFGLCELLYQIVRHELQKKTNVD